jgi:type I restriction-modification system DNA methylase subunit
LSDLIAAALCKLAGDNFPKAAVEFFASLGYRSKRTLPITSVEELQELLDPGRYLTEQNALLSKWRSVNFLFQLTGTELQSNAAQNLLLLEGDVYDAKVIKSYVFFAIDLDAASGSPSRSQLSKITRSLNRLVPMPVLVLFRHGGSVSIAIINRRRNLRDASRDVLTRVSLIRDIDCERPHRAHLDILDRFALPNLAESSGAIKTFADLDSAWQRILSVQELNRRFYRDLVDWFTWATSEIRLARLPQLTPDTPANRTRATQEFTVRLICRLLFAWFLKEMRLVPDELLELYDPADRRRVLTLGDGTKKFLDQNHYYRGILQNIFFQALNQSKEKRRKSGAAASSDRTVTSSKLKSLNYLGKDHLPEDFDYDLFDRIPYLNGGLFDKLHEDNASDTIEDGAFVVPNKLFYARVEDGYSINAGPGQRKSRRTVAGINRIFSRYRFTVAENTPLEEDVALDPELLGLVFENLLAEINPSDEAAAESARKASGSYYTPRRIVDYMVNEALHLHLRTQFEKQAASRDDLRLVAQLCYDLSAEVDFSPIADRVVDVIDAVRVLDPACGSGAFPIGMLHRMVELLERVDPENEGWKRRLLARLPTAMRADAARGMEGKSYNYLRKLGLVQKNLYGLDIQPLAAVISKLRFFLTLVIEQEVELENRQGNYGLQPLPNLETNLLCCNTLQDSDHGLLSNSVLTDLRTARNEYYQPTTSKEQRDALARDIGQKLATLFPGFAQQTKGIVPTDQKQRYEQDSLWLAEWFEHATVAAPFFDVETFFPELVNSPATTLRGEFEFLRVSGGQTELTPDGGRNLAPFHIVIGNPPYGGDEISAEVRAHLGLTSKDPYGAFIARFLGSPDRMTPLADGGVLSYIVSNTFMTIKTHRSLREQMLSNRLHKMIRVHPNTFKAVVNCAVILCQRGIARDEHTCLMADLTNVSIFEQYERFLHLLHQTEGFARRQNVANQTYAIYYYRQSLIHTNSNLPFFVASPKLFALMCDVENESRISEENRPSVAYNVSLNARDLRVFKLGDQYTGAGRTRRWLNRGLFQVMSGIKTGSNAKYLRLLSDDAQKKFDRLEPNRFLDDDEAIALTDAEKLNGITGQRCFVRFEMGMPADTDSGLLPCYHQESSQIAINWSREAYAAMREEGHSDLANAEYRFRSFDEQISFSFAGQYCPTFRRANAPVFLNAAPRIFLRHGFPNAEWLGLLNSKLFRYLARELVNHTVNFGVDDIKEVPVAAQHEGVSKLVAQILRQQEKDIRYDYASNEQLEIDGLVYAAYGLSAADIREVEDWYARRYPKLAAAQRRALAVKQGKTEEQLLDRPVLHLYCDESSHLPHDREPFSLLGLLGCGSERAHEYNGAIAALWKEYNVPAQFEAKWTKVSKGALPFYQALLKWFLATEDVSFRCLVLPEKQRVYAALPEASREHLYYRLYYQFLRGAIEPENRYRIFLDLKDTRGREKIAELRRLLSTDADDAKAVETLQHIRSHEVRLAQITDLLLGAVGFARRERSEGESPAKRALVQLLEEGLGQSLRSDSPPGSTKAVIATWHDEDALLL